MNRLSLATFAIVLSLFSFLAHNATAAEPTVQPLWPEGEVPGAKGTEAKDTPKLTVHLPEKRSAKGTAVVICPGGGYRYVAIGHEGHEIARWLNTHGIAAFVLDYRHNGNGYQHPIPLQDAQRAIRTVRAGAEKWKLNPKHIGIVGFSAGGHLASSAAVHFDAGDADADDAVERVSSRPDFAVLGYPVIAFDKPYSHRGSQANLLGENPSAELIEKMSTERQVTKNTPPTFLWHTGEDAGVMPENSVQFYLALRRAGVPAELHVYQHGRHGLGLATQVEGTKAWPGQCIDWLRGQGMLD